MLRTYEDVLGDRWTVEQELLATLVERVEALYRAFVTGTFAGPHNFGEPLRIPRPFDEKPEPATVLDLFARHAKAR